MPRKRGPKPKLKKMKTLPPPAKQVATPLNDSYRTVILTRTRAEGKAAIPQYEQHLAGLLGPNLAPKTINGPRKIQVGK